MAGPVNINVVGETFLIVFLAMFLVPLLLPIIVGLLRPGRKGRVSATRSIRLSLGDLPAARQQIVSRLAAEGFLILPGSDPLLLEGRREKRRTVVTEYGVTTHDEKPLRARVRFDPQPAQTVAHVEVWISDLILSDTGEGKYVDLIATRVAQESAVAAAPEAPPPNRLYLGDVSLAMGLMVALTPFLLVLDRDLARSFGLLAGVLFFSPVALGLPLIGLAGAWLRRGQVTGQKLAKFSLLLTLGGIAAAWLVFYALHRDLFAGRTLLETLRTLFPGK